MVAVTDPWHEETKTVELTALETVYLLSSLVILHSHETDYSPNGWLLTENLITKLNYMLDSYSTSNTGDGIPK